MALCRNIREGNTGTAMYSCGPESSRIACAAREPSMMSNFPVASAGNSRLVSMRSTSSSTPSAATSPVASGIVRSYAPQATLTLTAAATSHPFRWPHACERPHARTDFDASPFGEPAKLAAVEHQWRSVRFVVELVDLQQDDFVVAGGQVLDDAAVQSRHRSVEEHRAVCAREPADMGEAVTLLGGQAAASVLVVRG